jgi:hypothetical protein
MKISFKKKEVQRGQQFTSEENIPLNENPKMFSKLDMQMENVYKARILCCTFEHVCVFHFQK